MISAVALALFVLFSASLIGKILMHLYPDSGFHIFESKDAANQSESG